METNGVTLIGVTNYRNQSIQFGIRDSDRLGHIYCIGKTGTGKSTLLKNMAMSDIRRGNGLCVVDAHGDVAQDLLRHVPDRRRKDIIYFNPVDYEKAISFNPLYRVDENFHHLVASGLVSTLRKVWSESWGPRLEYILRFSLLTLLWYPNATLLSLQPLLTDIRFRNDVLTHVKDEHVLAFWRDEYEKYSPAFRNEAIAPILNKAGVFNSSLPLRNVIGKQSSFKMQQILDEGKILIVNLSKGRIGEDACALLGSMLVTSIQLAAMHRATIEEHERRPFYLYIDEMQSFVTLAFADILSEARKFKLSLFLTNQFIEQIQEPIRKAIFGNVGTIISFRVGPADAEFLAREFHPVFDEHDLINLPRYSMYLKLLIDGATSQPFSAQSLPGEVPE